MSDPTMALPEGTTCGDCLHYSRCSWLLSCARENTACDWAPSRFRPTGVAHSARRWRLVCHRCGFRYPPLAAGAGCCEAPELHVHNLASPCTRCAEDEKAGAP